jgi:hypothetical protein
MSLPDARAHDGDGPLGVIAAQASDGGEAGGWIIAAAAAIGSAVTVPSPNDEGRAVRRLMTRPGEPRPAVD